MSEASTQTRVEIPNPYSHTLSKRPWRPYVTPFDRILEHKYSGSGTETDPYLVDWMAEDPEDPQRWGKTYKWLEIAVAAISTLCVALSSSAYSGGIEKMQLHFGASTELLTGGISLFVVGFAFGPLIWAPLSEVYGRRIIYIISYTSMTLWTGVTIASPNVASLLVFRFLAGFFGSSPLANAGGTIADVLDANQRGLGMAVYAAAPFLGPALGPITGGFLGLTLGWRSIFIFLTIFAGSVTILMFLLSAETYAPNLLRKRAATLSKVTGKIYRFRADAKRPITLTAVLKVSLLRPWKFLVIEPIVLILSIYIAIIYGILYLNFSAYPIVFQREHGFNTGEGGLAFLGILVGCLIAVTISATVTNPQYIKIAKSKGGRALPEDRLPPSIWGGILLVVGLGGFAATDGPNVHWIAPIMFGIPFGCGVVTVFLAVLGYLIDSYTIYAASVLAANSVIRSLFGAAFPLFTTYMYENLGVHWAAALPGFLALACIPFTVIFYRYGASIRAKCKYAADAEKQMSMILAARNAGQRKSDQEANVEGKQNPVSPSGTGTGEEEDVEGGLGEKQTQVQPAEQTGGQGHGMVQGRENVEGGRSEEDHHLWTQYEALADRDMWDLNDEERLHLHRLHSHFGHAKELKVERE
ncbi:multiple drug resistance protein [Tremella mesenterica]|uniref:Multiple drug resistance protein n=1 Tax=Tremella mesenterica TaxID=5217 RepID=A0A4Q1B9T0_TREME|nr:multiple drug resistance protein [Tremella mesenterica]